MKKLLLIIVLLVSMFLLFGCNEKSDVTPERNNYVILKYNWVGVTFDDVFYNVGGNEFQIDTIYNKTNELPYQHIYSINYDIYNGSGNINDSSSFTYVRDTTYIKQYHQELIIDARVY